MPTKKTQWRYQVYVHPLTVALNSRNENDYLLQLGNWGTKTQAAREGIAVAASLASQKSDHLALQYSRAVQIELADSLSKGFSDGIGFQPEHTEVVIHVSLDIN